MDDLALAQTALDLILRLDKVKSGPLRQLDPSERGERAFELGDYHFKVSRAFSRYFDISKPPFGSVTQVIASMNGHGYAFMMGFGNGKITWQIERSLCEEMVKFLQVSMVLDELAAIPTRGHILSVEGRITS